MSFKQLVILNSYRHVSRGVVQLWKSSQQWKSVWKDKDFSFQYLLKTFPDSSDYLCT